MFQRLINIFRGFVGLFVSGLEKANPRALIEAEKENLRAQIARFNDNLATHAGFVERLNRQIKNLEKQEGELVAKTAALLKLGHRPQAGALALQLKNVREQLEENRKQIEGAETTFQKLIKARDVSVREAPQKIDSLKQMLSETEMLEAQAELQEMAKGMISLDRRLGRHPGPGRGAHQRAARQGRRPRPGRLLLDRHLGRRADRGRAGSDGRSRARRVRRRLRLRNPAPAAEPEAKAAPSRDMGPAVPEA